MKKLTRKEAEKIIRKVMQNHAGDKMQKNLFKESVDRLLEEWNSN